MTDDTNDKQPQPRRRRPAPDDVAPSARAGSRGAPGPSATPATDDDPMAALERLQSLSSGATPAPVTAAPYAAAPRPTAPAKRASRPRPAGSPRAGRMVARIAAPVVFLVAVVILFSLIAQSGVIGGKSEPVVTPTPTKTKAGGGSGTSSDYKVYVVKSGDTMSGIAVKFNVSTSELEALNPKLSSSTLVVGTKIKVPKPLP